MANTHQIHREIRNLENTLKDVRKTYDYLNEGFVIRFFKGGVLWLLKAIFYFFFVSGLVLLGLTLISGEELALEITNDLVQNGCNKRLAWDTAMESLLIVRMLFIILSLLFLFMAVLVGKIRRKNETVAFSLDMLNGITVSLEEHVDDLRAAVEKLDEENS